MRFYASLSTKYTEIKDQNMRIKMKQQFIYVKRILTKNYVIPINI
jgi:hypothetical protein